MHFTLLLKVAIVIQNCDDHRQYMYSGDYGNWQGVVVVMAGTGVVASYTVYKICFYNKYHICNYM